MVTKQTYKYKKIKTSNVLFSLFFLILGVGFIGWILPLHESGHAWACLLQGVPFLQFDAVVICFTLGDTWFIQAFPYLLAMLCFFIAFLLTFSMYGKWMKILWIGVFVYFIVLSVWDLSNEILNNLIGKMLIIIIFGGLI